MSAADKYDVEMEDLVLHWLGLQMGRLDLLRPWTAAPVEDWAMAASGWPGCAAMQQQSGSGHRMRSLTYINANACKRQHCIMKLKVCTNQINENTHTLSSTLLSRKGCVLVSLQLLAGNS